VNARAIRPRRQQAGFTLVELMISLVLFSFAIAGVLAVAVSMTQGFREQRAAVEAESAVRVPMDFIADAIRQASPAAPTLVLPLGGSNVNIQDANTCWNGAVTVTNNQSGSGSGAPSGWDSLDLIYASGAVVTSTRGVYTTGTTSLDITDASQLAVGDSIVISNTSQGTLTTITGISGNTLTLANQCTSGLLMPTGGYAAGSLVIRAQHVTFTLDAVDGIPTLMMDPDGNGPAAPQPLAEGIEDMQIALGVDPSGSGFLSEVGAAANDDDWVGNYPGDTALTGTVRAIRISLVSRTTSGLIGNLDQFYRPAVEDHAASTTPDQYRRRVLKTIVEIRNMAQSP
jgi:prepilin-type N-terminal cleavage/methylation domain-containing protein